MYWKCFQRFLESLIDVLIFNLDFAENFVSYIYNMKIVSEKHIVRGGFELEVEHFLHDWVCGHIN